MKSNETYSGEETHEQLLVFQSYLLISIISTFNDILPLQVLSDKEQNNTGFFFTFDIDATDLFFLLPFFVPEQEDITVRGHFKWISLRHNVI